MTHLVSAEAAKSLAVAYEAYHDAQRDQDLNAIRVWARLLIAAQNDTGIQFHANGHLEAVIESAGRRRAEEAA